MQQQQQRQQFLMMVAAAAAAAPTAPAVAAAAATAAAMQTSSSKCSSKSSCKVRSLSEFRCSHPLTAACNRAAARPTVTKATVRLQPWRMPCPRFFLSRYSRAATTCHQSARPSDALVLYEVIYEVWRATCAGRKTGRCERCHGLSGALDVAMVWQLECSATPEHLHFGEPSPCARRGC